MTRHQRVATWTALAAARHACEAGLISADELALLERRDTLRDAAVRVDDFPQDFRNELPAAAELASAPLPCKLAA